MIFFLVFNIWPYTTTADHSIETEVVHFEEAGESLRGREVGEVWEELTWAALRNGSLSKASAQPFCIASKKAARGPNSSELDFCSL